jgi:hypothetical protein
MRPGARTSASMPSNALLVCALLAPFAADLLYDVDTELLRDVPTLLEERALPILEGMRASRRDSERARQILMAQRRLAPSRKRRSRPMALVRRDWFDEALAVYELMHPAAEGEIAEEIARWHRLRRDGHAGPEREAELAPVGEPQARRRRRRRGGRKRRGRGGAGNGGGAASSGEGSPNDAPDGGGSLAAKPE